MNRLTRYWLDPDLSLGRRIGASAFLVGMAAMLLSGGLSLFFSLQAIPRAELASHRQTAQLFATQLEGRIEAHQSALRAIAQSTLLWTAISDSYGREAYLRPFLNDQEKALTGHRLLLLDYRARNLFGSDLKTDADQEEVTRLAREIIAGSKAGSRLFVSGSDYRMLTGFPVMYPYTREPIGVLMSLSDFAHLFDPLSSGLDGVHSLSLMSGDRVIADSAAGRTTYQQARQPLHLPEGMADIDLALEFATTEQEWIWTLLAQVAIHLLLGLLLSIGIWLVARRAAGRLTGRLTRLADACDTVRPGQQARLPADAAGDEIGRLNRAMHRTLSAYDELHSALEDRITERTAELNAVFDALPDLYFRVSRDGRILDYRAGRAADLYVPPAEFMGRQIHDILPPEVAAKARHALAEVFASKPMATIEYALTTPGGAQTFEARYLPLDERQAVAVVRNITERRFAEDALRQAKDEAERLARVKSDFLANMSHEIRTPLNGVLGMAHIGKRRVTDDPKMTEVFDKILRSGSLLLGVINDILDFSKLDAGRMSVESVPVELHDLGSQVVEILAERAVAKGIDIELTVQSGMTGTCLSDPLRLKQILLNLLSNAVKFTSAGRVRVSIARDAGELVFRVSDTGIGMTPEQLSRIFDAFEQADRSTTRNHGGTGLGLAITRRLVLLLEGTIEAHSTPGAGSVFEVRLPFVVAAPS